MRVRIIEPPTGAVDGVDVTRLHVGRVYDLHADLASYLVVSGFAIIEQRRTTGQSPPRSRSEDSFPDAWFSLPTSKDRRCPPCPNCGSEITIPIQVRTWDSPSCVCVACRYSWLPDAGDSPEDATGN